MKYLKMLGLAAVAAIALTGFAAGSASATTLEEGGSVKTGVTVFSGSLTAGKSLTIRTTGGLFANTCTESNFTAETVTPFTAAGTGQISAKVTGTTFKKCSEEAFVVDESGGFTIEWIEGTTDATLRSVAAKSTLASPFGTLTCVTGAGTDIGKLTGAAAGKHAVLDLNAVVNCGIIPSSVWQGEYTITSPTGLGVVK